MVVDEFNTVLLIHVDPRFVHVHVECTLKILNDPGLSPPLRPECAFVRGIEVTTYDYSITDRKDLALYILNQPNLLQLPLT